MVLGMETGLPGPDVELLGMPELETPFLSPSSSNQNAASPPPSLTPPCSQLRTAYVQFYVLKISFWAVSKCAAKQETLAV